MNGPTELLSAENNWETRMGLSFPGERVVYRGKDLFHDLKHLNWMQLYLYGISDRVLNEKQTQLLEGIWVICTSYPDPRIWNNRIAALAGTVRTTGSLGISAAIANSEATIFGQRPVIRSIDFLVRTKEKIDAGDNLSTIVTQELKLYRVVPGYGRPIIREDERITPLMDLASGLGFDDGYYVNLAFKIEKILTEGRWRLKMNAAALIAALIADIGLTPREHYLYMTLCFTAGIVPCYLECVIKPEGTFLPIRCNRIAYQGRLQRKWSNEQIDKPI